MRSDSSRFDAGMDIERRRLLAWSAAALAAGMTGFAHKLHALSPTRERVVPGTVRLLPSVFADAVAGTRRYLMQLVPGRLLHNFYQQAGLPTQGEVYGGWESDTIAGHTLGHYLSALCLMYAGNGDIACKTRADAIVAELMRCQQAGGDGYVAGFTRKREDGTIDGGRVVLDEISRGQIEALPFRLNGSWAPFYTWHKLCAGLLDAHRHCGNQDALEVLVILAGYIEQKLAPLNHEQMQQVLDCEFGGMPESLAELSARTQDARWLVLARRFRHDKVLEPLAAGRDELNRLHANTQIPKILGAARGFELDGARSDAAAALFFWQRVVHHHSYAIGGHSDREYFQAPDTVSRYITEQTCEHCNTLNMVRLGQYLHRWSPDIEHVEFHERALYNHILSQQHPDGGRYTYMTPMMTGEARTYSEPEGNFWCCVGTGMESHAQFSDAIYALDNAVLTVDLYIPSMLEHPEYGLRVRMESDIPHHGNVTLTFDALQSATLRVLRLRKPSWAGEMRVNLNGETITPPVQEGYARIERDWQAGDRIALDLSMPVVVEPCMDDPTMVSLRRGPCVLAADLGAADAPWDGHEPWLPSGSEYHFAAPDGNGRLHLILPSHPHGLSFAPFYALHDRRYAVYFRYFDADRRRRWEAEQARQQAAARALDERSLDYIALGDADSEAAHALVVSGDSYALSYRRQPGRDVRTGGVLEFTLRSPREAAVLRLRYWGEEFRRRFSISINGIHFIHEVLDGGRGNDFVDVDYRLPLALRAPPADGWRVRIVPETGYSAGPAFGAWLLAA